MSTWIDLVEDTLEHFKEGARSVRAYTDDMTYIITRDNNAGFIITTEEAGFPKTKADSLEPIFTDVFGIEAKY
jgi:hypothetical protein